MALVRDLYPMLAQVVPDVSEVEVEFGDDLAVELMGASVYIAVDSATRRSFSDGNAVALALRDEIAASMRSSACPLQVHDMMQVAASVPCLRLACEELRIDDAWWWAVAACSDQLQAGDVRA